MSFPAIPADIRAYNRAAKKAGLTRAEWIRRTLASGLDTAAKHAKERPPK